MRANAPEQIAIEQVRNAAGCGVEQQSLQAAKEIADRTEGKAPQTVNWSGDLQIENSESRREWAERKLSELMRSETLSRAAAIKQLRAAGATRMLECSHWGDIGLAFDSFYKGSGELSEWGEPV